MSYLGGAAAGIWTRVTGLPRALDTLGLERPAYLTGLYYGGSPLIDSRMYPLYSFMS